MAAIVQSSWIFTGIAFSGAHTPSVNISKLRSKPDTAAMPTAGIMTVHTSVHIPRATFQCWDSFLEAN